VRIEIGDIPEDYCGWISVSSSPSQRKRHRGCENQLIPWIQCPCARVLAGINRLSTTLADRGFRIMLIRKRGDERLERFSSKQQGNQLARLRDDLHLTALQYAKEIADAYDRAAQFPILSKTGDRLRDILEPPFAIA
jgi:hypothetical protein